MSTHCNIIYCTIFLFLTHCGKTPEDHNFTKIWLLEASGEEGLVGAHVVAEMGVALMEVVGKVKARPQCWAQVG